MRLACILALSTYGILFLATLALELPKPQPYQTQLVDVSHLSDDKKRSLSDQLQTIPGVHDVILIIEHGIAYLKVDNKIVDETTLQNLTKSIPIRKMIPQ